MNAGLNQVYHDYWIGERIFREPSLADISAIANWIGVFEYFYPPLGKRSKRRHYKTFFLDQLRVKYSIFWARIGYHRINATVCCVDYLAKYEVSSWSIGPLAHFRLLNFWVFNSWERKAVYNSSYRYRNGGGPRFVWQWVLKVVGGGGFPSWYEIHCITSLRLPWKWTPHPEPPFRFVNNLDAIQVLQIGPMFITSSKDKISRHEITPSRGG